MLFQTEKLLILHPGKCGGTTIENLFLRSLRNTNTAQVVSHPCFAAGNNGRLTTEFLRCRVEFMTGFLPAQELNGVSGIYLQHADIAATIALHGKSNVDSLFKTVFVRNPFPRILSAFFYNAWDRRLTFEQFVRHKLEQRCEENRVSTVNHFGELHRFTHYEGELYADFLGRLENVEADVAELSRIIQVPLDLSNERQHAKTVATTVYEHYSQAYDERMVDLVYRLYRRDFDLFGYTFKREVPFRRTSKLESRSR
jgi:hypothetical protein